MAKLFKAKVKTLELCYDDFHTVKIVLPNSNHEFFTPNWELHDLIFESWNNFQVSV